MLALQDLIGHIRNLRAEYGIDPGQEVRVLIRSAPDELAAALEAEHEAVVRLARADFTERSGSHDGEPGAHAVLSSGAELFLPLADVIDLDRERGRLDRELDRVGRVLADARGRLSSEQFIEKAPAEVVEREREKARSLEERQQRLEEKRRALGADS